MTRKKLIETAEMMDVDIAAAMTARVRFLAEARDQLMTSIDRLEDSIMFDDEMNEVTKELLSLRIKSEIKELKQVDREIKSYTQLPREGEITDDMVVTAREYPIENLVEFKGGRCKAFCHESDSFSVAKSRNANGIWCHVCNRFFNPIDVLIHRDGYSFPDAVRQLT